MILYLAGLGIAAASCPTLTEAVRDARAAFDDAEVELAGARVRDGYAAIACQELPLTNDELLGLYWLDAVVAISREDRKSAQYAVIRAVTAAPEKGPPQDLGPELAELYATWRGRLEATTALVTPRGGGRRYLDGLAFDTPRRVLQGEHVFQHEGLDGFESLEVDVVGDQTLDTGLPGGPAAAPVAKPTSKPQKPVKPEPADGTHPTALVVIGGIAVAAGAGGIGWAFAGEQRFGKTAYDDDVYGSCARTEACWADERATAIRADASQVNLAYGTGYGLLGLGGAMLSVAVATWGGPAADVSLSVGPNSAFVHGRF